MNPKKKPQPPAQPQKCSTRAKPPYRNHQENLGDYRLDKILFGFFAAVVILILIVLFRPFGG